MKTHASFEAKTYSKVDRRLIPFLFLCYILAYLDRVNVGFAKLEMLNELSLSDAAFAMGAGIFFIGYFFFEVPSNILLKKFGARMWIARIMVSWGIISSAMMFVQGEWSFYAMRFLLGIAEAGFFPGIIYYLTLWYPSKIRATRTAWFVSAIAVSGVIGNPVSGWIMDTTSGHMGMSGWQWLFLIEGIPSIIVGIWVFFYLDSSIQEARWLNDREKRLLIKNLDVEDLHKHEVRVIDAFKSGKVYVLSTVYFTLVIGLYGVTFWLPTIIKAFGIKDYSEIGLITAIPYGVSVIGMILLSRSSDRTGERRFHYIFNITAGAVGLILSGVFSTSPILSVIFLSMATVGIIGSIPLFWPIPSAFLTGTAAAAGIGIVNSIGNLGGYIGPNVPIWVKTFSSNPSAALYAIAGILLIGALLVMVFIPESVNTRPSVSFDEEQISRAKSA
ncbi:MFS transporter [Desulfomonile tiedjei]|uniref:Sugar phosphate permease n=1 Tax=Desulfomonile tiedjei (strain ATCC 49306 / DSM 6799 / DCB-1) TaxID=706587 RepID=I4CDR9_DESTA|nr:MFS transporter [Desulfomonile tiedjei]AFM27710.1 sugar phosphate permease [Desulfomonile tiedjei DSM 6799]